MSSKHLVAQAPSVGKALQISTVETTSPRPGEIVVRNHAVAIQPLDAKIHSTGYGGGGSLKYPAVLGSSGAGIVERVGKGVDHLSVGDRVVFDTRAYVDETENGRQGTWQQLVAVDSRTVSKIGQASFEQAVLVDFPLQTAVAALKVFLGMGKPTTTSATDEKVLIWGAGGAVGSYAVQYAKSVGHTVIVTASPRDIERQKALGASNVVGYKASDAVERLRKLGPYKYLFTASGDPASQEALASLLQPQGGRFASVLGGEVQLPANVERVYKAFSQAAQTDEYREWSDWWYTEYLPKVLQENLVEPVKFTKREGGLEALQQASTEVAGGKVRGKLLIYPQE